MRGLVCPFLGVPLAACATVLSPGPFVVPVASEPPGAAVIYRGLQVGTTPCEVEVWRGSPQLTLRLEGYHPRRVDIREIRNPWASLNLMNLGVGIVVDVALGTDRALDTTPAVVRLMTLDRYPLAPWQRCERRAPPSRAPDPTGFDNLLMFLAIIGKFVEAANR